MSRYSVLYKSCDSRKSVEDCAPRRLCSTYTMVIIKDTWICACVLLFFGFASSQTVCDIDMVIVVDASGSICQDKRVYHCADWERLKQFTINIVNKIYHDENSASHRFGMVVFGNAARVEFELDKYKTRDQIVNHIRNMAYEPWQHTKTDQGLTLAMDMITTHKRPNVTSVITVITDGKSTDSAKTLAVAKAIQDSNTSVIAVGVTNDVKPSELRDMSSSPHLKGQNYFEVPDVDGLKKVLYDVVITACTGPVVQPNVCPVDLVILCDMSGSICDDEYVTSCDDWRRTKTFAVKLVERLDAKSLVEGAMDDNRFALVTYGSAAKLEFGLVRYKERASVVSHIDNLRYTPYQQTNAGAALKLAKQILKDARPGIPSVVVIVTDGYSNVGPDAVEAAKQLHAIGTHVISVGVTDKIHEDELKAMASEPRKINENYFEVPDTETLKVVVGNVARQACHGKTSDANVQRLKQPLNGLLARLLRELKKGQ